MANKYCRNCGNPVSDGDSFCENCGTHVKQTVPHSNMIINQGNSTAFSRTEQNGSQSSNAEGGRKTVGMVCKRCGGTHIITTPVAEMDKRGCLSTLLKIILLFIPIIGWIALFSLIRGRKTKTRLVSVCQDCGYKWYSGGEGSGALTVIALIAGAAMLGVLLVVLITGSRNKASSYKEPSTTSYETQRQDSSYNTNVTNNTNAKIDAASDNEDREVGEAIKESDDYLNMGDYSTAYHILTDAKEKYPWRSDLGEALVKCESIYADDTIWNARQLFYDTNQDYDAAIAELKYVQRDLPNNEAIINEIAKYESYRPIGLDKLSSFYDENGHLYFVNEAINDNCGNTYTFWAEWDDEDMFYPYSGDYLTSYKINRHYRRITGTFFVSEKSKNKEFVGSISIYGDGKLLAGPFEMGKGVAPIDFDVDIETVVELQFRVDVKGKEIWDTVRPHLANVMLYPKIDTQN